MSDSEFEVAGCQFHVDEVADGHSRGPAAAAAWSISCEKRAATCYVIWL